MTRTRYAQDIRPYDQIKQELKCDCSPFADVLTLRRWNALGFRVCKGSKAVARVGIYYKQRAEDGDGNAVTRMMRGLAALFCRCQVERR